MPEIGAGRGRLILVAGPSGAGKDAVIDGARRRLAGNSRFVFPLRTITRPEGFGGEIHVAVTPAQFDRLRRLGAFAVYWGARGLNYAIPASIDHDLASGRIVIANVSSVVFREARSRYPGVVAVWVTAAPELRRARLKARGRETPAEVDERLLYAEELLSHDEAEILVNEGSLDEAVDAFLTLIDERVGVSLAKHPDLSGIAATGSVGGL